MFVLFFLDVTMSDMFIMASYKFAGGWFLGNIKLKVDFWVLIYFMCWFLLELHKEPQKNQNYFL